MAYINLSAFSDAPPDAPAIRKIGIEDLRAAISAGIADFRAMPTHVMFLVVIYPIIGLVIARLTLGEDLLPLAYPLAAGFALLGPFAALGVYELSRRREQGLDLSWTHAFDVLKSPSIGSIAFLGLVQMMIFIAWIATAHGLYTGLLGSEIRPHSLTELVTRAVTTPHGVALIMLGNGIGFLFAVLALALSVVSYPLLLDRPVGAGVAMMTSIRAVLANPAPMAVWGLFIAAALILGSLPFFIGLTIILPILGHSTWHLYRRVVVSDGHRR